MRERSLVLIKPDAMKRNLAGPILERFQRKGLKIIGLKLLQLSVAMAERHYDVHKGKSFFPSLIEYITSTPIVAVVFEGENAISMVRETMGSTDPKKSEKCTIRAEFGLDIQNNAVHGSDSPESASKEIALFFSPSEVHSGY